MPNNNTGSVSKISKDFRDYWKVEYHNAGYDRMELFLPIMVDNDGLEGFSLVNEQQSYTILEKRMTMGIVIIVVRSFYDEGQDVNQKVIEGCSYWEN